MLTKLLPDQVATYWAIIKYAVEESVPPTARSGPEELNNILAALVDGRAECWVQTRKDEDGFEIEALLVTLFQSDEISDTKALMIYCLFGLTNISPSSWAEGLSTLVQYALSKGCDYITAYSANPEIVRMVGRLGGDTEFRFLRIPLK